MDNINVNNNVSIETNIKNNIAPVPPAPPDPPDPTVVGDYTIEFANQSGLAVSANTGDRILEISDCSSETTFVISEISRGDVNAVITLQPRNTQLFVGRQGSLVVLVESATGTEDNIRWIVDRSVLEGGNGYLVVQAGGDTLNPNNNDFSIGTRIGLGAQTTDNLLRFIEEI